MTIDEQLARILELDNDATNDPWLPMHVAEFRTFAPKAARALKIAIAAFKDIANVDYEELDSIAVKTAKTALAAITKELES